EHVEVLAAEIELVGELVGAGAGGLRLLSAPAAPAEETPGERAPGHTAHALRDAERDHLALLLAVDEVVVVLHRNEPRPAAAVGGGQGLGELPGGHAARAQVAHLARLH